MVTEGTCSSENQTGLGTHCLSVLDHACCKGLQLTDPAHNAQC